MTADSGATSSKPPGQLAAILLAAGKGTRMKSDLPKVMHQIGSRSMIGHVLDTVGRLGAGKVVVVIGPDMDRLARHVAPHATALQARQLGTGDAVRSARAALDGFSGDVLILYGDVPLVTAEGLARLRAARTDVAGVVVYGMRTTGANAYGRLVLGPDGTLDRIVEYLDASPVERQIDLCNSGIMLVDGSRLFGWLDRIGNKNEKGEYYLTDLVALARADGVKVAVVETAEAEVTGVNSRAELAAAEAIFQARRRSEAMAGGATLTDPASVFFAFDTVLGRDVVIGPSVVFGPGVSVGDGVEIRSFCHLEGTVIEAGAIIGPFARLRPGAKIGPEAHVGNFVEVKNAVLGAGAKANHLTYIGDATIGARANIGAGTITCNYDGFLKYRTEIGEDALIGSNTALVAPVRVGDRAITGSGSVITEDVADDALAIGRGRQVTKQGWATGFRAAGLAAKQARKSE